MLFQVYVLGLILNPHYQMITDDDCDVWLLKLSDILMITIITGLNITIIK